MWCLTITWVGIDAAYNDLRIIVGDGVTPPISRALTNYIRSPPWLSIVCESKGLDDMTYKYIFLEFAIMIYLMKYKIHENL